jgi:hypothetical protein
MNESRVVKPDVERLPISNGDWLLVKKQLSAGDRQDGYERAYMKNPDGTYVTRPDGTLVVSPANMRTSMVTSYLVDWSLVGLDDKPLDIRGADLKTVESILRALDYDSFKEIFDAIDAWDTKQAKARAAQKKILSGAQPSSATSPSPSASGGATSGSETLMATSTT